MKIQYKAATEKDKEVDIASDCLTKEKKKRKTNSLNAMIDFVWEGFCFQPLLCKGDFQIFTYFPEECSYLIKQTQSKLLLQTNE